MTVGSLFSGIGGFDLGFERAGFEIKWQVEIDPFCRAVLAKHWPDVRRYEDVRTVGSELERVDVVCGGFPCQPVSRSGKQLAQADDRWLWPEFRRLICDLRPRYVVVENVPGLFDGGMGDVLGDLADLGFDAEWSVVSLCALGAPHPRARVLILAYPARNDEPHSRVGSHPDQRFQEGRPEFGGSGRDTRATRWLPESTLDRVAYGISRSVVQPPLGALGNGVSPILTEWIARRITEAESCIQ